MTDFSVNATQVSDARQAGAQALAPVQERAVDAISPVLGTLDAAFDLFSANKKAQAKLDLEEARRRYSQKYLDEQSGIDKAAATGQYTISEASAKSRANFNRHFTGDSRFSEDIVKLKKGFSEGSELGEVEDAAKTEKERRKAGVLAAQSAGIEFPPNAAPQTQDALVSLWQSQVRAKQDFEDHMKKIEFTQRQGDYNDKKAKEAAREGSLQFMSKIATSQVESSQAHIQSLMDLVAQDPANADKAKLSLTSHFAKIETTLQSLASQDPAMAGSYRSLFNDLKTTGMALLDPTSKSKALEDEWKSKVLTAKLAVANADPKIMGLVVASELFKGNASISFAVAQDSVNALIQNATRPTGGYEPSIDMVTDPKKQKDVVSIMDGALKTLNNGSLTGDAGAKARTEARNSYDHLMEQTADRLSKGMPPKDLEEVMKHFSSPAFGQYMKTEGASTAGLKALQTAVQVQYREKVVPTIGKHLEEFVYGGAVFKRGGSEEPTKKVSETVEVVFNGSGVQFRPRNTALSPVEASDVSSRAKELNSAAMGVNRMVQLAAHLEGSTDYAAVWEKRKHEIVPQLYPSAKGAIVPFGDAKYRYKDIPGTPYYDRSNWELIK